MSEESAARRRRKLRGDVRMPLRGIILAIAMIHAALSSTQGASGVCLPSPPPAKV
jgi:hypothetical protein